MNIGRRLMDLIKGVRGDISRIGQFKNFLSNEVLAVFELNLKGKEYPLIKTSIRSSGGRRKLFDIKCHLEYKRNDHALSCSLLVDLNDMTPSMAASFIRGDGSRLAGYLVGFEDNYGSCLESMFGKYPWLSDMSIYAKHSWWTRLRRRGEPMDYRITDFTAAHLDPLGPRPGGIKQSMAVELRPIYKAYTVEVDYFMMRSLRFDSYQLSMDDEDVLVERARHYIMERRLESL